MLMIPSRWCTRGRPRPPASSRCRWWYRPPPSASSSPTCSTLNGSATEAAARRRSRSARRLARIHVFTIGDRGGARDALKECRGMGVGCTRAMQGLGTDCSEYTRAVPGAGVVCGRSGGLERGRARSLRYRRTCGCSAGRGRAVAAAADISGGT